MITITGSDSVEVADRLCDGLEDAELSGAGTIVVDIVVVRREPGPDGATELTIEALTVADD